MRNKDIKHLEWIYDRMKYVYNENEMYDYMIKFREILETLRQNEDVSNQKELLLDFMTYVSPDAYATNSKK